MRIRELAVLGGSAWVAAVLVVALASDLGVGLSVLLGLLGLLVVAALAALVGTTRALRRIEANAARAATAPRRTPSPKATELASGPRWAALSRQITRTVDSAVGDTVDRELSRTFRQVEALHNLYAMIDIEHALPASRGWPASPDLLLLLVDLVDRHRPTLVVECGSGLSTLCFALAMRRQGIDGKVIALEHLEPYAEQSRELLRRHGVSDIAEVRFAPLEPVVIGDLEVDWYARPAWDQLDDVGLLFVDGPPGGLSSHSRYPSVPYFVDRLAPGAHVVLDDYRRDQERDIVARWQREYGDHFTLEAVPLEKGAALLTFGTES